jgi:hypothetical protein
MGISYGCFNMTTPIFPNINLSGPKLLAPSPRPSTTPRPWRDRQILCLDHGSQRLYAELVDIIDERNLAWVKPLWLVHGPEVEVDFPQSFPQAELPWADAIQDNWGETLGPIDDLRGDSDLLWPVELFRAALDMELLPLLGGPLEGDRKDGPSPEAQRFRLFIRQVWEAHRSLFQGQ